MDMSQVSVATTAVATAVRQLHTINEAQMAIMKSISQSQQQMAQMIQAAATGANLNVQA